jgi:hypothetical protein
MRNIPRLRRGAAIFIHQARLESPSNGVGSAGTRNVLRVVWRLGTWGSKRRQARSREARSVLQSDLTRGWHTHARGGALKAARDSLANGQQEMATRPSGKGS